MPFIRHSRDRRGFERTYVMHAYRAGQGGQQAKVLYLFRTPANVKIGRKPLDAEVLEALEHTHPDLNFDWTALRRDSVRHDERDRPGRGGGRRGGQRQAPGRRAAPAPPVVEEVDESVLGQALGAAEADRLRKAYADLLQRISRRARTPEDRDRLTARAARLNPDEWPDEAAAAAAVQSVEAEWDAIAAELPARRRGRRGGRRHEAAARTAASGIMAEGRDIDEESTPDALAEPDRVAVDGRDGGGLSAESGDTPGRADDVPGDD